MREIGMYRGQRLDNKEWAYGYYVNLKTYINKIPNYIPCIFTENCYPNDPLNAGFIEVDPKTVGEYTSKDV